MAPPPIPASINASTSSSVCTLSQAHGVVKYVDTSDDNIRMDDQDKHTPRQTRLVSKKHGVVSPGLQGPSAQHVCVDDSVCRKYFIWISKLTIPCRMLVGHIKISIKNACRFLVGLQRWPAKTVLSQESLVGHWRSGLMNLSLHLSPPRERRPPGRRCLLGREREREKSRMIPVHVRYIC